MAGSPGSRTGRHLKSGRTTADRRASASAASLRDVGRNEAGQDPIASCEESVSRATVKDPPTATLHLIEKAKEVPAAVLDGEASPSSSEAGGSSEPHHPEPPPKVVQGGTIYLRLSRKTDIAKSAEGPKNDKVSLQKMHW